MKLSQLVFRSMRKNIKQYYLYFFALIFSVTLFFSFITLQFNDAVHQATIKSGTATAGFEVASYMLYFIVLFFVLYANHLFMKRRSKEIGLYQLIGMRKGLIVRLIAYENILLFAGAVAVGIGIGYLTSRLFAMILLQVIAFDGIVVGMSFSLEALGSTVFVFAILLFIVLLQQAFFIRKVSLLSLFTAAKQGDERVKRMSWWKMLVGFLGIVFIAYGYYASTKLFEIDENNNLFLDMFIILATTIGGTFLVFRFSVSFLMNLIRLKKGGHLNTVDVVAITPIMHRMKSNAKSLTLITILTAVSLAITTLSYIAYYSVEDAVKTKVPADYILMDEKGESFLQLLDENNIAYEKMDFPFTEAMVQMERLLKHRESEGYTFFKNEISLSVISQTAYNQLRPEVQLREKESIVTGYSGYVSALVPLEANGTIDVSIGEYSDELKVVDIHETTVLGSGPFINGQPMLVVTDDLYELLERANSNKEWPFWTKQTSVNLLDKDDLKQAEALYTQSGAHEFQIAEDSEDTFTKPSQEMERNDYLRAMGVTIFTTGFLGLAFLLATGSILYFKQMSEADEETEAYNTLRKIGFSEQELMRGIYMKQLFNFGVPLLIGLLHSYFAVKSGWFLFGTELVTPLIVTMGLYILMYFVFGVLSISYYKKVIRESF